MGEQSTLVPSNHVFLAILRHLDPILCLSFCRKSEGKFMPWVTALRHFVRCLAVYTGTSCKASHCDLLSSEHEELAWGWGRVSFPHLHHHETPQSGLGKTDSWSLLLTGFFLSLSLYFSRFLSHVLIITRWLIVSLGSTLGLYLIWPLQRCSDVF